MPKITCFSSFSGNPELPGNPRWVKKLRLTETNILVPHMALYLYVYGHAHQICPGVHILPNELGKTYGRIAPPLEGLLFLEGHLYKKLLNNFDENKRDYFLKSSTVNYQSIGKNLNVAFGALFIFSTVCNLLNT